MVSGPGPIGRVPTINYRPDPGEPAARLSAPQTQTAGLVTLQEQRNETRLLSRALSAGEDVLYSKRTFTLGVGEQSPVFNAGLTTLISRKDPNGFLPDRQVELNPQNRIQTIPEPEEEEDTRTSALADPEEAVEPTDEELEQDQRELENEDSRLDRNLTQARLTQENALERRDAVQLQQAARQENKIERRAEDNEKEQRRIELEQFEKQMEDTQDTAAGAVQSNLSSALGFLDVMFGLGREMQERRNPPRLDRFTYAEAPRV